MFGELEHYKNKEYYDNHKTINIYTLNDERKYEIIYVFSAAIFDAPQGKRGNRSETVLRVRRTRDKTIVYRTVLF